MTDKRILISIACIALVICVAFFIEVLAPRCTSQQLASPDYKAHLKECYDRLAADKWEESYAIRRCKQSAKELYCTKDGLQ